MCFKFEKDPVSRMHVIDVSVIKTTLTGGVLWKLEIRSK